MGTKTTKGWGLRMVHVGAAHRLCGQNAEDDLKLPLGREARRFLENCARSDGAVILWRDGVIVGFFRYGEDSPGAIRAIGTWVHPDLRRLGLAERLWAKALKSLHVTKVKVPTISPAGNKFVAALRGLHSDVEFAIIRH